MYKSLGFILLIALFIRCDHTNQSSIALSVNNREYTVQEFQEIVNEATLTSEEHYAAWLDRFIDKELLYQLATAHGYDTCPEVVSRVRTCQNAQISQLQSEFCKAFFNIDGYIKPADVEEYKQWFDKKVTLHVLVFDTTDALGKRGDLLKCNSPEDYQTMHAFAQRSSLKIDTITSMYPFGKLTGLRKKLISLPVGEWAGPFHVYNNPYWAESCFIKKEKIENLNHSNYSEGDMWAILQQQGNKYLYHKWRHDVLHTSACKINVAIANRFFQQFAYDPLKNGIDTLSVEPMLDSVIVRYTDGTFPKSYTVGDFIAFCNRLPMVAQFKSNTDFQEYILDMVLFHFLRKKADTIGFFEKPVEKIRTARLLKDLSGFYLLRKEREKIKTITEQDIKGYYDDNVTNYQKPDSLVINCYFYASVEDAVKAFDQVQSNDSNTDSIENQSIFFATKTVPWETMYHLNDRIDFSQLRFSTATLIHNYNELACVAVKKGVKGYTQLPLAEVQKSIFNKLIRQYQNTIEDSLLLLSKDTSRITINVSYHDYFNSSNNH